MHADYTDGSDLSRLADDGCPHDTTCETVAFGPIEVWTRIGNNDQRGG